MRIMCGQQQQQKRQQQKEINEKWKRCFVFDGTRKENSLSERAVSSEIFKLFKAILFGQRNK